MTSPSPAFVAQVVQALREGGALARTQLQTRTGLSRGTVAAVVADLLRQGLVDEVPTARSGDAGRPPALLRLNARSGLAAGLDIGKRHVRVAVCDLGQQVLDERHEQLPADVPAAKALDVAALMLDEVLSEIGVDRKVLVGAGLAVPGPLHATTGELGSATILPGWVGTRPREEMQDRLGAPVRVDNDANLGALAEWTWGAGRGCDDLAYVKLATGIGCGLVIGGRPCRGAGGTAGEIGHLLVSPDGPVCRCGNRGCLETMAGADAVLALLRSAGAPTTIAEVVASAHAGDAACRRVLADTGALLGQAVAAVVNLVNPARLVVGGPLAGAGDVLLDALRQAVARSAIPSAAADLDVRRGELGDRAEVLGALALVLRDPQLRHHGAG